jgi:hypothetical protein
MRIKRKKHKTTISLLARKYKCYDCTYNEIIDLFLDYFTIVELLKLNARC